MQLKINELYYPAFESNCRVNDIWGGRGRGGSHVLIEIALTKILTQKYFRGVFVRQVFNDIKTSLFQDFIDLVTDLGIENDFKFNTNELTIFHKISGNNIISRGLKAESGRTAKSKSISGITDIFIDEADELDEFEYSQLTVSLRTTKTEIHIYRCFNPPRKSHWIWQNYNLIESEVKGYYKAIPKSLHDFMSIFATYKDNIDNINRNAVYDYERFKETNPEYYYTMICGLISEGKRGRIYTHFKPITDELYKKIEGFKCYALDFGYSEDPNALIEIKKVGNTFYCKELLYLTGLDNVELAKRFIDLGLNYKDTIIADYGGGGDLRIAELRRGFKGIEGYKELEKGFNIRPVQNKAIKQGIYKLKSKEIYFTESSLNAWNEQQEYSWALDKDKQPTDNPIDKHNHILDALRYFALMEDYF